MPRNPASRSWCLAVVCQCPALAPAQLRYGFMAVHCEPVIHGELARDPITGNMNLPPELSFTETGGHLSLTWTTDNDGRRYQPQRSPGPASLFWTDLAFAAIGDGSNKTCQADLSVYTNTFFRVEVSD